MGFTFRCGVCSMCLTLFVSPDSARGGLGRARVLSLLLFSFWSKYPMCLLEHMFRCKRIGYFSCKKTRIKLLREYSYEVEGSIPRVLSFFSRAYRFFYLFLLLIGTVWFHNSEYLDS